MDNPAAHQQPALAASGAGFLSGAAHRSSGVWATGTRRYRYEARLRGLELGEPGGRGDQIRPKRRIYDLPWLQPA
ncbi:MAG: hypothetical protein M3Z04_17280 [Chloroflexota bacterium]|nr:hypothetical protein [Chloroflexota bacterium]